MEPQDRFFRNGKFCALLMTMAERAMISRTTLVKVESGDPGVSLGIFATVLFVLRAKAKISRR